MTDRQVKVSLIIDDHGSVKVMRQAGEESQKTEGKLEHLDKGVKKLGSSFGGLKTMIGAGLGALGIGGLAFGIKDVVSNMEEMATKTEKFHATTGIGAQQSLDYTAALEARGVGAEAGANAFKFLAKNIQSAERQYHTFGVSQMTAAEKGKVMTGLLGVQAGAFKELGINLGQFAKLSEQGKFEAVTRAFENMQDGAKKTRLAVQVFGRGGTALLPVLDKGALGLSHFTAEARKFFPTIKGGQQGLEEWKVKQGESKLATEGLEFTLGMKLVPTLIEVEGWFSKTILGIEKGHGAWGTLERDVDGVVGAGKTVVGFFEHSTIAADGLKVSLGLLGLAWGVDKVIAFTEAIKGLAIIQGISTAIRFMAGGDVLLTLQVAALDAAGGVAALGTSLAGLALYVAPIAALAGAVIALDKVLPSGDRPENLLGGNQPGEAGKEGEAGYKAHFRKHPVIARQMQGIAAREAIIETAGTSPKEILQEIRAIAHQEHTTKAELHIGALKVAEALIRDPRSNRLIAEGVAHHTSKMAARGGASR